MLTIDTLTNIILNVCDDVSNKKLQKLVYYVYAWHIAIVGQKIANINFEAWEHGPVCRRLYNMYRSYGWNIIPQYNGFVLADDEKIKFIHAVLNVYGGYSANELECMTHREKPWIEARDTGISSALISDTTIKVFYSQQTDIKQEIIDYILS